MITIDEIQELLHSTETYRVERTTSTGDWALTIMATYLQSSTLILSRHLR